MSISQKVNQFRTLHLPEKLWILTNLFKAVKVYKTTRIAQQTANEILIDSSLDGDANGGQVDAFRHCLWMALLSQHLSAKTVEKLGYAHESGNRIDFEKHSFEDGSLADSAACVMDMRNNKVGISIGKKYQTASKEELVGIIKEAIREGKLWIVKKNTQGECLDYKGNVIEKINWQGKWYNSRCLVPSNYNKA